jgi:predicted metal-binding membrane protein
MAMAGVSATGWSFGGAVVFVAVWTVMMAAMMLPATAPMILIFASAQARRERHAAVPTWIFTVGYLLVWLAADLLVYVVVQIGRTWPPG